MYKIAVMGDWDSIYGFAALGLETVYADDPEFAAKELHRLAEQNYGIIYIVESLAEKIKDELDRYRESMLPAVILIPGIHGNTGLGIGMVKKSVEQAVGSDIIFNDK